MRKTLPLIFVVLLILLFWFVLSRFFTLSDIQRMGRQAADLTASHPLLVLTALATAQMIGMVLSLPTKTLINLLAAALFGVVIGSLVTLSGVVAGTTILFFAARHLVRERIARRLGHRVRQVEQRISERPIRAMIGLRLFVTLPYGPITLAAALSSMRYRDFIAGTLIGDIPVIVLYSIAAERLFSLNSVSEALSPTTVAVLIAIGVLFLAGALAGKSPTGQTESDKSDKSDRSDSF